MNVDALKLFSIHDREAEFNSRIERAASWLAKAQPETSNRLAYKLFGLSWSSTHAEERRRVAKRFIAAQRDDSGWAQFAGLESDAWATGQALVALHESGAVMSGEAVYDRGVAFLLHTQFQDGSRFVRTRTWPFQPYFNSQFPHGKDQWISAAGTTWAMLALLNTIEDRPSRTDRVGLDFKPARVKNQNPVCALNLEKVSP